MTGLTKRVRAVSTRLADRYFFRMPPRSTNDYATHLPILIAMPDLAEIAEVVEFGAGVYSTPLFLDRNIYRHLARLRSFETDATWAQRVTAAAGGDPRLELSVVPGTMAKAAAAAPLDGADLILIDDSLAEADRCRTIEAIARRAPSAVVVIHDFEVPSYRRAAQGFRYAHRLACLTPNVGVLWNAPKRMDVAALRRLDRRVRAAGPDLPLLDRGALKALFGRADTRG